MNVKRSVGGLVSAVCLITLFTACTTPRRVEPVLIAPAASQTVPDELVWEKTMTYSRAPTALLSSGRIRPDLLGPPLHRFYAQRRYRARGPLNNGPTRRSKT
jgi:hypothetical protein